MEWQAVTALCAVAVIASTVVGVFVRQSVGEAIARLKFELLELLDERYIQRREWQQWVERWRLRQDDASGTD
jgi:hypothetical protein